jgi:hypothetical protein
MCKLIQICFIHAIQKLLKQEITYSVMIKVEMDYVP